MQTLHGATLDLLHATQAEMLQAHAVFQNLLALVE